MADSAAADARVHLLTVLHRLADEGGVPRDDQLEAVAAVIAPKARVVVVQATGWGNSAVYWSATSAHVSRRPDAVGQERPKRQSAATGSCNSSQHCRYCRRHARVPTTIGTASGLNTRATRLRSRIDR